MVGDKEGTRLVGREDRGGEVGVVDYLEGRSCMWEGETPLKVGCPGKWCERRR